MVNFVRLWGPLWTHSAFRFESMNGHITGMIHSRYNIAKQLLFSIDVATTMSVLADKLKSVEDEETLSYLTFRIYLIEICHCSFSERIQLAYYTLIYLLPMNARPLIDAQEQGLILCYSFIDFTLAEQSYTLSSMADQEASVIVQSAAFRMEDLNCLA